MPPWQLNEDKEKLTFMKSVSQGVWILSSGGLIYWKCRDTTEDEIGAQNTRWERKFKKHLSVSWAQKGYLYWQGIELDNSMTTKEFM